MDLTTLTTDQLLHELTKSSKDGYVLITRGHRYDGVFQWRVQWRTPQKSIVSDSQTSWRDALIRAVEKKRQMV